MPVVKGTKDIFSPEIELMEHIYQTAIKIYKQYGFTQIDTPVMEYTDLFKRSIGSYTDIVQKEMFTFLDRKDRSITLRPEGTASVVRAFIDNSLAFQTGLSKLYYLGPMFRAERPQKGRLREFHQFGCEAIGSINPLIDAEIIEMQIQILKKLKIDTFNLLINSVGCKECRKEYTQLLKEFLTDKTDQLCENCQTRAQHNPLRIFDCKNESCQTLYQNAPYLFDHLCSECQDHFNKLEFYLKAKKIAYKINKTLVRGFDYYSKTVFEIQSSQLGAQNALLGGGRYDYLVELLGGKPTPAVGTAVGVERLMIALKEGNITIDLKQDNKIYIAVIGSIDNNIFLQMTHFLREKNHIPYYTYDEKSLKAQLKEADKLNCSYCLILGEEELKNNQIVVRSLKKGDQENVNLDEFYKNYINELTTSMKKKSSHISI